MSPKDPISCQRVQREIGVHISADLMEPEKTLLKQHLLGCKDCQREYEQMWHVSLILDDLSALSPPTDLLADTQSKIRQVHHRQRLASFVNPFNWLLSRFQLSPPPRLVNYAAIIFYVVVSVFLLKLAFLEEDITMPLTTKPLPTKVRIVQIGAIKKSALDRVSVEDITHKEH